jgi:hypothetical protein
LTFATQNGLQKADTLLSLLCNVAVEYAIAEVQVNESRLKLNGPHQLPLYANYVNLLRESINTIHENSAILLVASKNNGLQINAEKTKYMLMSLSSIECRTKCYIKTVSKSVENVAKFKYLQNILKNQNNMHEEVKSILYSGNACYCLAQNLLPSLCYLKTQTLKYTK